MPNYLLLQPSPAKAAHRHGNPCVGANEPNCHHNPYPFNTHLSLCHHLYLIHPLSSTPYICLAWVTHVPHHRFSHVFACATALSHPHPLAFTFTFTCTPTITPRLTAFTHLRTHVWRSRSTSPIRACICSQQSLTCVHTHTSVTSTLSPLWLCALALKDVGFWWCDKGYSCCCCGPLLFFSFSFYLLVYFHLSFYFCLPCHTVYCHHFSHQPCFALI